MIKIALSRLIDDYPKIKDLSLSLHYLQKKKKKKKKSKLIKEISKENAS